VSYFGRGFPRAWSDGGVDRENGRFRVRGDPGAAGRYLPTGRTLGEVRRAYAAAAAAITVLISTYSVFVLDGFREGVVGGGCTGALYGFLYHLLRLEDYALLAGSLELFAALALVMLLTRRVNWYGLKLGSRA
jgi:inner membrane protein involved in colicin E2 resistance